MKFARIAASAALAAESRSRLGDLAAAITHFRAALAAGMLGARPVPVNWHFQADEVGYVLRDSGAKALVGHSDLLAAVPAGKLAIADLQVTTEDEVHEFGRLQRERIRRY